MQKNRFQVAGYLAAKPELRFLPSGTKVASARLGESYRFTGKDKQVETHTNWHRLTFYDDLADLAVTYEAGDHLFAEGSVQQRQFTPADGSKRTVHEVVVKSCHVIAPLHGNKHLAPEAALREEESPEIADQNWPI
jgi:single-strand DNA-binding protein